MTNLYTGWLIILFTSNDDVSPIRQWFSYRLVGLSAHDDGVPCCFVLEIFQICGHMPKQLVVLAYARRSRSEEHTSELQSRENLVCRLLLEKKNVAARHGHRA